jgi:hypothetical protein
MRLSHVAKCMNLERYIVNPNKASTVADIDDRCARGSCTVVGSQSLLFYVSNRTSNLIDKRMRDSHTSAVDFRGSLSRQCLHLFAIAWTVVNL